MSLYQKIRPTKFSEMIGNLETIKSLKKIIKSSDRPHTFLFTGERGTGKTTAARILANDLGCSDIDLEELNGSDNRGIDDARRCIEIAHISPLGGKCRVIIWDEAHKLTNEAQNAMLKVLEDTPKSTYFILCSTDPDKLLKTVKSRCTNYRFTLLKIDEMIELIFKTLDNIQKEIDEKVIESIVNCAMGSPREVLVLLEQVLLLDSCDEQLKLLKKTQIEHETIELCRMIIKVASWKSIVEIYKGISDPDSEMIRRSILGYFKNVLLNINGRLDGNSMDRVSNIIKIFSKSTYDSGEAELINMLYQTTIF